MGTAGREHFLAELKMVGHSEDGCELVLLYDVA
jgi:hypothetical protein